MVLDTITGTVKRLRHSKNMQSTNRQNSAAHLSLEAKSSAANDLLLSGFALTALGLFHILVWLILGGEWEGPVSWRKPILFGVSTGLTLLSIGYFFDRLIPSNSDPWLIRILSIALVAEVSLITIQQWRGQASHFNHDSTINTWIEYSMTILIVLATLILLQITYRTFSYLNMATDLQFSIRAGMAFLIISCVIGFFVLWNGNQQMQTGGDPSTFGKAGVTKFPHGIAIHSLQFFPCLCFLFAKLGLNMKERMRSLQFLVAWMSGLLGFSLIQTLTGNARFQWTFAGACLFAISTLFLLPVIWLVSRTLLNNVFEMLDNRRLNGQSVEKRQSTEGR